MDNAITIYEKTGSIKTTAKTLGISVQKVRKILINAGAFESDTYNNITDLRNQGKTVEEIMSLLSVSRSTVHAYLPYSKVEYKSDSPTENALKIRKCREKKLK